MSDEEEIQRLIQDPEVQRLLNDPVFLCDVQAVRCGLIHDRIGAVVRPAAEKAREADASMEALHVVLLRIVGWLRSVAKLTNIADFQAHASAARFMFETSVDLTLLAHHPDATIDRIYAWFDSHRLKLSEDINEDKSIPGDRHRVQRAYESEHADRVMAIRKTYFKGKHPAHWCATNWLEATRKADEVKPAGHYIDFVEFYRTRYADMCFHIHSGAAGVARMPDIFFPQAVALYLKDVADLALLNGELVLRILKKWDVPTAQKLTEGTGNGEATLAVIQRVSEANEATPRA